MTVKNTDKYEPKVTGVRDVWATKFNGDIGQQWKYDWKTHVITSLKYPNLALTEGASQEYMAMPDKQLFSQQYIFDQSTRVRNAYSNLYISQFGSNGNLMANELIDKTQSWTI